jgi:hypothetical protein
LNQPPVLMPFNDYGGDWSRFEDAIYAEYLTTVAHAVLQFQNAPVKVRFQPTSKQKAYGFWHLISEAPSEDNRNEDDRIPDPARCERVRWVAWCIQNAGQAGVSWWENHRKNEIHVVIWAEEHDFAVVLAKRNTQDGVRYYLLKTAYCLKSHRRHTFAKERDAYWATQKD